MKNISLIAILSAVTTFNAMAIGEDDMADQGAAMLAIQAQPAETFDTLVTQYNTNQTTVTDEQLRDNPRISDYTPAEISNELAMAAGQANFAGYMGIELTQTAERLQQAGAEVVGFVRAEGALMLRQDFYAPLATRALDLSREAPNAEYALGRPTLDQGIRSANQKFLSDLESERNRMVDEFKARIAASGQ